MDNYLFYIRPSTAEVQGGDKFRYIASQQFKRVGQDDVVWMVTMDEGRLTLLLRFHVGANVDREVAQRRLGETDLWEAKYHLLTRGLESVRAQRVDINSVARRLRFIGETDRLPHGVHRPAFSGAEETGPVHSTFAAKERPEPEVFNPYFLFTVVQGLSVAFSILNFL